MNMQFTPLGSLVEGSARVLTPQQLEDTRERLEAALARLEHLYDEMSARAALLDAALGRAEGLRQTMLSQLDAITPDADLEPSLGASAAINQTRWAVFEHSLDLEDQCEDEGAQDSDREPSLGCSNPNATDNQEHWAQGGSDDLELDESDKEPSLGSREGIDQTRWADHGEHDREYQCEDEGFDADLEPDTDGEPDIDLWCPWQDEGDQTRLRRLDVYCYQPPARRAWFQNVGELTPVRVLAPDERAAAVARIYDEYDILALGEVTPAVIARELAVRGVA